MAHGSRRPWCWWCAPAWPRPRPRPMRRWPVPVPVLARAPCAELGRDRPPPRLTGAARLLQEVPRSVPEVPRSVPKLPHEIDRMQEHEMDEEVRGCVAHARACASSRCALCLTVDAPKIVRLRCAPMRVRSQQIATVLEEVGPPRTPTPTLAIERTWEASYARSASASPPLAPRAPLPRAPPPRPRHSLCSVACRSKTPWHGARADARAERHAAARALQMLPSQLRASAPSVRTVTGCCGIRACGSQQEHRRVLRGRRMSTRKQHSRSASKHLSRACARRTCLIMISTKSQVST